jgi:glycosyltransferase involved in cell wall biosynthesis
MIAHILSVPKKVLLYRAFGLGSEIDRIIVYSSAQRSYIHEQLGFPLDDVHLVPFMVDTAFFDPDQVEVRPVPMICSAGLERRDYPTLIEAVRGLDVRVVIAAASPWSKRPDTTNSQDLPENVEVRRFGFVDLRQLYADAAFVVVPLEDVDFQAGVTTILEAMSMGRAVICSRSRGQTDVIRHDHTGVYVSPNDPIDLRNAIVRLLRDPSTARRLGCAAREQVEQTCDVTVYAQRLAGLVASADKAGPGT